MKGSVTKIDRSLVFKRERKTVEHDRNPEETQKNPKEKFTHFLGK